MDYYIYKDNQNVGPLAENEVVEGLRTGRFLPDDLGCRVGEERWIDLNFFFPNVSNQAHVWMEPQKPEPPPRPQALPVRETQPLQQSNSQWTAPSQQQQPQQIIMPPQVIQQPVIYQQTPYMVQPIMVGMNKSRASFIILGIFLGYLGVHNFYAGYAGRGIAQLLLTLFLFWTIIVPIVVWIWVIIEIIVVDRDKYGNRFI